MSGNFRFAFNLDGSNNPPSVRDFPVAGSQTLVAGDLVIISSGLVTKAAASVAEVLGVMMEDSASQTASTPVKVAVITPSQVWRGTADAAATAAVLGNKTYDLNSDQTVDIADASNGCIQIVELGDSTTDVYVSFSATRFGS